MLSRWRVSPPPGIAAYAPEAVDLAEPASLRRMRVASSSADRISHIWCLLREDACYSRHDTRKRPAWSPVSHAFWQRQYGGAPDVVGLTMTVANRKIEIVGIVTPASWAPTSDGHSTLRCLRRIEHSMAPPT